MKLMRLAAVVVFSSVLGCSFAKIKDPQRTLAGGEAPDSNCRVVLRAIEYHHDRGATFSVDIDMNFLNAHPDMTVMIQSKQLEQSEWEFPRLTKSKDQTSSRFISYSGTWAPKRGFPDGGSFEATAFVRYDRDSIVMWDNNSKPSYLFNSGESLILRDLSSQCGH